MLNYKSDITTECITNYTICVKTPLGIRNMRIQGDIEADLVYVNNVVSETINTVPKLYLITKGTCVRYTDIYISPRTNKFI